MVSSIEEMVLARDTLIFLLQDLIFFINRKKTVFQSRDVIQSIGMEIDSVNMILDLPQVKKKVQQYQFILTRSSVTIKQ